MVSLNRWQKERPGQKFLVTWGDIIGENLATVSYYILNYCQTPTSNYPCSRVTCKLLLLSHVSFPLSKTKASSFKGPPMFSNSLILSLSLSLSLLLCSCLCERHGFHLCHWSSCSSACSATLDCSERLFSSFSLSCHWFVTLFSTFWLLSFIISLPITISFRLLNHN